MSHTTPYTYFFPVFHFKTLVIKSISTKRHFVTLTQILEKMYSQLLLNEAEKHHIPYSSLKTLTCNF